MHALPLGLLAGLLALLAACRHVGPPVPARAAQPLADPAAYALPGPPGAELSRRLVRRGATLARVDVRLAPQVPEELAGLPHVRDPIELIWLTPHPPPSAPCPVVLLFPILANTTMLMCEFGGALVNQGFVVGIVPRKDLGFDPHASVERAEDELRALTLRSRQALDWICAQPEADADRVGVLGISAGGLMATCLAAVDPRVKATVLIFAGGPMADVLMDTVEKDFVRKREATLRARGWTPEQLRQALHARIRTDPVALAPAVRAESVLFFLARDDRSVPTARQEALWQALGRPERIELAGGHYGAFALFFPHILHRTRSFLTARLALLPPAAAPAPGG